MTIPPLFILAIGILTVIGLIIFVRINAFIALITAALVVSFLAPGPVESKVARVAQAFGTYAGNIGIVIALAAVIGKCMMDSGAADRIVRAFLKCLGEKRASFALMGSGFVLSVPVFFDTVFYLLVPLARSLYRRTGRNYLKYLLAIAAGGAVTHTMVPPTPGPLGMAANLNISVGEMILVGALVGFPASLVGLLFCSLCDRLMPIEMRKTSMEQEAPEPIPDDKLPSLAWALAPVVLPVLMISANTVMSTLANNEHVARVTASDITDPGSLATSLSAEPDIQQRLADRVGTELLTAASLESAEGREQLAAAINEKVLRDPTFYDVDAFESVLPIPGKITKELNRTAADDGDGEPLSDTQRAQLQKANLVWSLLTTPPERMKKYELERLNRLLLELTLPTAIASHEWDTSLRKAANLSSLIGNANLALLVSTVIALVMLIRQTGASLGQMAIAVETSLMSGATIILITAAGGAFGAMLKVAEIGGAIESLFAEAAGAGMFYLFLGFGIATLLKIAQGSGTTSMLVSSAMLAAMVNPEDLSYSAVYLATAIGAGSLVGSWMNDSGFWIFAKMGGLTEAEALKSWTPLLIVLGIASLIFTLALANIMPLVPAA